jgi:hypothetical protein
MSKVGETRGAARLTNPSLIHIIPTLPPGLLLIAASVVIIYITAFFVRESVISLTLIAVAFFVALGGIALLFRSAIPGGMQDTSLAEGSSDVEEAVRQLGKNYDILRRQATQGFLLAGSFMAMGILVILTGSLGEMFGFTKTTSNLTTIAGVVVEVISGLGLYLFKETFKQLNATSDKLHDMWKILAAFKKTEDLPEERKADVVVSLINKLVDMPVRS